MNEEADNILSLTVSFPNETELAADSYARQLWGELNYIGFDGHLVPLLGDTPPMTKGMDPVVVTAVIVAVVPNLLAKALDFLQAWAVRREERTVRIKVQSDDGTALEVEAPVTMARAEIDNWIQDITKRLSDIPRAKVSGPRKQTK